MKKSRLIDEDIELLLKNGGSIIYDRKTDTTEYREKVLAVKELLDNDISGIVNSVLDFSINCALVEYSVKTSNSTLTAFLNDWLLNINSDLRGKIPVGIKALATWLIKTRKGDMRKITGSLNQQIAFNKNDDPKYAKKMEKVREEVKKQLDKK